MRNALLAMALLGTACAHATNDVATGPQPLTQTTVKVENQNFLDMEIFVLREGQRVRLGMVTGKTTQVFKIPAELVQRAVLLSFELHPISGPANPRTQTIMVRPGDRVELTIPPV